MSNNWGHVEKVTKEIGGKTYTFKSLLEMRWCVYCQLRKEQGIIHDWFYESEEVKITYKTGRVDFYRPDFTIECFAEEGMDEDGAICLYYAYEETKGWFTSKDYTKMKLMSEQYDNPLTLIFANLTNSKSARAQYGRAKRLEKLLESNGGRIIYDANETIFKKIRHLFV